MWHSYTRHNVQKPRLSITKSPDEVIFVLLSLQTLQLQLYTEAVTRLMECYRENLWEKDRLGALNLQVRICLDGTPINTQKKIIMHQSSWSYASSITQPSWRWSYQHRNSYTRWLQHTPINTRKDYHTSTFLIIRIKHNPTILALELSRWKELHKMVTSHTDQYTKRLSCINLHDHTHQA